MARKRRDRRRARKARRQAKREQRRQNRKNRRAGRVEKRRNRRSVQRFNRKERRKNRRLERRNARIERREARRSVRKERIAARKEARLAKHANKEGGFMEKVGEIAGNIFSGKAQESSEQIIDYGIQNTSDMGSNFDIPTFGTNYRTDNVIDQDRMLSDSYDSVGSQREESEETEEKKSILDPIYEAIYNLFNK